MRFDVSTALFEHPEEWTESIPKMLALCDHFARRPTRISVSATETIPAAREFAASLLRPEGMPHLWMVECELSPGEWRTLAATGNADHAEASARFIALSAHLLPKVLAHLLPLAEAEAAEQRRHAQPDELSPPIDELSMEAICYDI